MDEQMLMDKIDQALKGYEKKISEKGMDSLSALDNTILNLLLITIEAGQNKIREVITIDSYKNVVQNAKEQFSIKDFKDFLSEIISSNIKLLSEKNESESIKKLEELKNEVYLSQDYNLLTSIFEQFVQAKLNSKNEFNSLIYSIISSTKIASECILHSSVSEKDECLFVLENGNNFSCSNEKFNPLESGELKVNMTNVNLVLDVLSSNNGQDILDKYNRLNTLTTEIEWSKWLKKEGVDRYIALYNTYLKANKALKLEKEKEKNLEAPKIKIGKKYKDYKIKYEEITNRINSLISQIYDCGILLGSVYELIINSGSLKVKLPEGAVNFTDVISNEKYANQVVVMLNMAKTNLTSSIDMKEKERENLSNELSSKYGDASYECAERILFKSIKSGLNLKELFSILKLIGQLQSIKTFRPVEQVQEEKSVENTSNEQITNIDEQSQIEEVVAHQNDEELPILNALEIKSESEELKPDELSMLKLHY